MCQITTNQRFTLPKIFPQVERKMPREPYGHAWHCRQKNGLIMMRNNSGQLYRYKNRWYSSLMQNVRRQHRLCRWMAWNGRWSFSCLLGCSQTVSGTQMCPQCGPLLSSMPCLCRRPFSRRNLWWWIQDLILVGIHAEWVCPFRILYTESLHLRMKGIFTIW